MPVTAITDPDDERLADYRALTDVELRTRWEPPHGLFIAEGELVLRRALRAGFRPRSFLVDEKRVAQISFAGDAPVYAAGQPVLEKVTGFHVHRGVLASFHRRPLPSLADVLAGARRLAILEDVNNHTNIGAVFRGAAALGIDGMLLSPSCADPLYRRSVRVSMGEVFAVPYATVDPWPAGLAAVRDAGFTVLALTPAADARADPAPGAGPATPGRAAARRRRTRPVPARAGRQRRTGGDPHAPWRRLAQRGRRRGGRVLGAGPRRRPTHHARNLTEG